LLLLLLVVLFVLFVWLLWWFHRNHHWRPLVLPPRGTSQRRGVFATRAGAASEKRMFGENKVPLTTPIFLGRDGRGN